MNKHRNVRFGVFSVFGGRVVGECKIVSTRLAKASEGQKP
jgi:hypothetical protein